MVLPICPDADANADADVNADAANGLIHRPIGVNVNMHAITLTRNFDAPSEIFRKKDMAHSHSHSHSPYRES